MIFLSLFLSLSLIHHPCQLTSPVVNAWRVMKDELEEVDLFSTSSIPALSPDKATQEPGCAKEQVGQWHWLSALFSIFYIYAEFHFLLFFLLYIFADFYLFMIYSYFMFRGLRLLFFTSSSSSSSMVGCCF